MAIKAYALQILATHDRSLHSTRFHYNIKFIVKNLTPIVPMLFCYIRVGNN
jgi:hypothetical protein